jgi:hypothetical protein
VKVKKLESKERANILSAHSLSLKFFVGKKVNITVMRSTHGASIAEKSQRRRKRGGRRRRRKRRRRRRRKKKKKTNFLL